MTSVAVIRTGLARLFEWKIRGVRWIEIIGVVAVAAMVFSVYIAKAAAAREGARIGELEQEIAQNRQRVRLLRAELAHLEQPGRLESLSRAAGLQPVDVHRQATEAELSRLNGAPPTPAVVAPPAAPPAPPAVAPSTEDGQ